MLDGSLDPQHLPEGVLVAVLDLKLLPGLPEVAGNPGVAHLGAVGIDRPGPVDLAQLGLHVREPEAHLLRLGVAQDLDGFLVNLPEIFERCFVFK